MPWHGIHHAHLVTVDQQETTEFYTEVMGFDLLKELDFEDDRTALVFEDGTYSKLYTWVFPEDSEQVREKVQAPFGIKDTEESDPYYVGAHHVAWGVDSIEDVREIQSLLEEHGVETWGPVNRSNMAYNLYFEDPCGNNLEIHSPGPAAAEAGSARKFNEKDFDPDGAPIDANSGDVLIDGSKEGVAKQLRSSFWAKI